MNLEMKKSKLFLNKIDMKYKYIKLLLRLKINLRNPNIIDVGDDNSHTITLLQIRTYHGAKYLI
jgi:hypothetical protein